MATSQSNKQHAHHHGCAHGEHGGHADNSGRRLGVALGIIAGFAIVEIIGGLLSGSLALLADAGHMVTDAAALALALSAQWLAKRPVSDRFPFGWKRAQVLAAFLNAMGLLAIVGFLLFEAFQRLGDPQPINAPLMLGVAVVGLAANIAAFLILHPNAADNVNVRGAMLHVAADIFGSVAAIISAFVILGTNSTIIDPILTLAVCALILRSAIPLLVETGAILMQAAPKSLAASEVKKLLKTSPLILDVHDCRAWQLTPGETMISLHAVIPMSADPDVVLRHIKDRLRDAYGITESTVQLETVDVVPLDRRPAENDCPDNIGVAE
ncbi:cation diffusion facilitator family transporter [Parvularcula lutaonensis]|uniref:Cation diffusion facilitator family transporter n=1 Tax=Parvularcula lutaonensis TaxID=491923 RepID=A0ABV7ME25_9PROT|nr:cation diffusion facilitator family transporter [Parvularcula lutaonensis]GGY52774.1 zinc transporter ZitB [Parvularcula lutaonensis]